MKLDHRKVSKRKLINCRECQSCGAMEANANLRRHDQEFLHLTSDIRLYDIVLLAESVQIR